MGNHIFVVGQENFQTCVRRGLCGGIRNPRKEHITAEVIAGFKGIREGDYVFFYVKQVGVRGLWRVVGSPFYAEDDVWGNPEQVYPYRVRIEPIIRDFPNPVLISDIYDLQDKGRIWTVDFGTMTSKSHNPITTDESKEIIRLLLRNNPLPKPIKPVAEPYSASEQEIPLDLSASPSGQIKYEGYLNAWFMNSFAHNHLRELFGDYYDFVNLVPTSFNTIMDIFLTHVTRIDSVDILHKLTCIELKTGVCTEDVLKQVIKYEQWLARKQADGDREMVQSVLVGIDFAPEVIDYVRRRQSIEGKGVRLLKYNLTSNGKNLDLTELEP
jgi:hypothetical protein